jgi:lysozyme
MSAPATELQGFLGLLERRYGRRPVVYTTREFDATYLRRGLMGESFWVRSLFLPPRFRSDEWVLWQYHHRGRRPGIAGPVDLDAFRGTRGEFEAWAGGRNYNLPIEDR